MSSGTASQNSVATEICFADLNNSTESILKANIEKRFSMNYWTEQETEKLIEAVKVLGSKNWNTIADFVKTRNAEQCRQKFMRFKDINKGITEEEEFQLINSIFNNCENILNSLAWQNSNQSKLYLKKRLDHYKETLCERYCKNVMLGIKKEKRKGKIDGYFDSQCKSSTSCIPVKLEFDTKTGKKFKIIKKNLRKRKAKLSYKDKSKGDFNDDCTDFEFQSQKENWTFEQDKLLLELFDTFGDNWSSISKFFNERPSEDLEERYQYLKKDKTKNAQEFLNWTMYKDLNKPLKESKTYDNSQQNKNWNQSQIQHSDWISEECSQEEWSQEECNQEESSRIDIGFLLSNPYSSVKSDFEK